MVYRWRLTALAKGIRLEEIAQKTGKNLPFISRASHGLVHVKESVKVQIAELVGLETKKAWRKVNG